MAVLASGLGELVVASPSKGNYSFRPEVAVRIRRPDRHSGDASMLQLRWSDFAGAEGTVYQIRVDDAELDLTLETAEELPPSGRSEGSFRLEFRGPSDPILPQAIYRFRRGDESADIFIVPVGRDARGTLYEAVFC